MIFQSKKDVWIGVIIWASIFLFVWMLYDGWSDRNIIIILLAVGLILFIGSIWFRTRYIIQGEKLIVQSGLIKQSIEIQKITSIRETKSILSAPALSIERLEINYHPYETGQISPRERDLFLEKIREINPDIQLEK